MSRVKHNAVHQFTAGLNNAPNAHPANVLPFTHPVFQGWKVYYEQLTDGAVRTDDGYWEITASGSGTIGAGADHSLVLTAQATTENTGYALQKELADIQLSAADKKYYLETRVKLTHASGTVAGNEWFVGWTNKADAHHNDGILWEFTDGFGFGQLDELTPVFVTNSSDAEQSIKLSGALTTAVYRKYACYFDSVDYHLYEDDVLIARVPANPAPVVDVPFTFNVNFKVGEAKTNTFEIQYALLACEL